MTRGIKFGLGIGLALALSQTALAGGRDKDDDKDREKLDMYEMRLAPAPSFAFDDAMLGATPGGAQDINFARAEIEAGRVPHPNTFTPEGLFSQHDLPLPAGRVCKQLLCLSAAAVPVELTAQPEARTLAQLGFDTNIKASTWRRDPLNLVAVVDKSGSMSGPPLETVKASLHAVVRHLNPEDQLTVVLYGERVHIQVPTTPVSQKAALDAAIDSIVSEGSTYMEAGLGLGFDVARQTAARFHGRTRVMLFTDERPNVGDTSAKGFMGMARAASRDGIGLTTVGVGEQFGAELATAISAVRGGNLFFFPTISDMTDKFDRDLDTMVTELAHDLKLVVRPLNGNTLVGLYGVPGEAVKRLPDGGLEMDVETIFASHDKGGIFFAFAPGSAGALPPVGSNGGPVGEASVRYADLSGVKFTDTLTFDRWNGPTAPLGLARGRLLVDEVTSLKAATAAHLEKNDQEGAYRLVHTLRQRFEQADAGGTTLALGDEVALIGRLDETLAKLSGHKGETLQMVRNPVSGLPE